MAPAGRLCCAALLCGALSLCSLRAAPRQPDTLYMWIDAQQARVLIGFEEDILIVSEGKMAPFTHDFRKAQQRMPAIPVGIHAMNFTWQATGRSPIPPLLLTDRLLLSRYRHYMVPHPDINKMGESESSCVGVLQPGKINPPHLGSPTGHLASLFTPVESGCKYPVGTVYLCALGTSNDPSSRGGDGAYPGSSGFPPFPHEGLMKSGEQEATFVRDENKGMTIGFCESGIAEYYYEFLSLHSLDKGIMADPTINIPLLGTIPHKASVVQVGFPCLGKQDGVAAFEVNVIIMNSEGNIILQTPQNAIFFKTCQQGILIETAELQRSAQEDVEMEGFATKDMSVNVQMDFTGLIVRKQIVQQPVSMEAHVSIWENAFVLRAMRETSVKSVNAISPVEMEANVLVGINANAPKATRETCVQSLSVNLAVACMAPVWSPTNASAKKAGMGDIATKLIKAASSCAFAKEWGSNEGQVFLAVLAIHHVLFYPGAASQPCQAGVPCSWCLSTEPLLTRKGKRQPHGDVDVTFYDRIKGLAIKEV
ncbi:hypothetical protein WISP_57127 [Willisornis vidua]|uniref:WIF domain-containing protein n=1 Tax=Willisornis vidua TaxID=1566151 RepID=A0ABQ9DBR5_9PASS|nr:hypothetical protein WISP_57127 [Willisornis vidua]